MATDALSLAATVFYAAIFQADKLFQQNKLFMPLPVEGTSEIQDLSKLDASKLNPLSIEVISRQATINVGTIGHVFRWAF